MKNKNHYASCTCPECAPTLYQPMSKAEAEKVKAAKKKAIAKKIAKI